MVLNEKNTSKINKNFIKNYEENSNKEYIFEVDVEYPKRLQNLHNDIPFLPEIMKIKKSNLYAIYMMKTTMLYT